MKKPPSLCKGRDPVDRGADVRIYADGKFRNRKAPLGERVGLIVTTVSGFSAGDTRHWMDIEVVEWAMTGTFSKKWQETAGNGLTGAVRHVAGNLTAGLGYRVGAGVDRVEADIFDEKGRLVTFLDLISVGVKGKFKIFEGVWKTESDRTGIFKFNTAGTSSSGSRIYRRERLVVIQ